MIVAAVLFGILACQMIVAFQLGVLLARTNRIQRLLGDE